MKARDFRPENFARFHPGGSLGRRLLGKVDDEMATEALPFVSPETRTIDVLRAMTLARLGLAIVRPSAVTLGWGLITDGDVRRAIEKFGDTLFAVTATELMSLDPAMIATGTRVEDALVLMEKLQINSLLVLECEEVVGVFKK